MNLSWITVLSNYCGAMYLLAIYMEDDNAAHMVLEQTHSAAGTRGVNNANVNRGRVNMLHVHEFAHVCIQKRG